MIWRRMMGSVVGVVLLAGCTQIPSASEVEAVDPSTVISESDIDVLTPGPSAGASPEEILQGFVAAGAAAQNNYRVARSYLTEEFADQWNPNQLATIRLGEATVLPGGEGQYRYQIQVLASVDEAGRYQKAASATPQELTYLLEQEAGQWRISSAPDGIILSESAFREAFESFRLFYYSSDYQYLVPDLRWFASRGDVLSKIIRGLFEEPSYWLGQGATVSAFPTGTQLVLSPVPVVEGQAQVDLNNVITDADGDQRQRMRWQLLATLQQVSGVSDVAITVDQTPIRIVSNDDQQPSLGTGRDPRPLVVRGFDFGYVQGDRIDRIETLSDTVASLRPDAAFFEHQRQEVALVNDEGLWVVDQLGTSDEPWDTRPGLIRPVIDSCGYTWSMTDVPGEESLLVFPPVVIDPATAATAISVELPQESKVVTMELARDNTRLLLLVQTETAVRTLLTAIQRGADCEPVGLTEFTELTPLQGSAVDAAFVDEYQVAIVTRVDVAGEVTIQDVNGQVSSAGRPATPKTLVAGVGGLRGMRLLTDQGTILQPRGNGWQATGERATVLVTER